MWGDEDPERPGETGPRVGPPVTLRLPGGDQGLTARLIRRRLDPTGEWWADITVALWSRVDLPTGRAGVEPADIALQVPMDLLTPIPGQETAYRRVPTLDLTVPRPWAIAWRDVPADGEGRGTLHRRDCARARTARRLTDAEAQRELLAGRGPGGIAWCDVCRPQYAPQMRRVAGLTSTPMPHGRETPARRRGAP